MRADDFEFDGKLLSELGCIIVQFDESGGFNNTTAGSELTLSTVSRDGGRVHSLTSATYDNVFTSTISFAKPDGDIFSVPEYTYIMHWLNKKSYGKLRVIADEMESICFYGTFNSIEKVEHRGGIVGFTLTFTSNAPFGWGEQIKESFDLTPSSSYVVDDQSNEIGTFNFDYLEITCNESGTLQLENHYDNNVTVIKDCTAGEVLYINGQTMTVQSSLGRNVYESFNFVYPYLTSTRVTDSEVNIDSTTYLITKDGDHLVTKSGDFLILGSRVNMFTSTIACSIYATFTPMRKVVF